MFSRERGFPINKRLMLLKFVLFFNFIKKMKIKKNPSIDIFTVLYTLGTNLIHFFICNLFVTDSSSKYYLRNPVRYFMSK